jgi:hypothetical protein
MKGRITAIAFVVALAIPAAAGAASGHQPDPYASSEVFELNTFGGNDTVTADAGSGDDKIWNNGDGHDLNTAAASRSR